MVLPISHGIGQVSPVLGQRSDALGSFGAHEHGGETEAIAESVNEGFVTVGDLLPAIIGAAKGLTFFVDSDGRAVDEAQFLIIVHQGNGMAEKILFPEVIGSEVG